LAVCSAAEADAAAAAVVNVSNSGFAIHHYILAGRLAPPVSSSDG